MRYQLSVNQKKAMELGVKNINQAHILDLLMSCSTWASPVMVGEEVYYWVARQKVCEELPLLGLKDDTVYRHFKYLAEIGLIDYKKDGKKDCIRVTKKGKSYYVGNESELSKNTMSEINPNHYVGNESEKQETRKQIRENSEINPKKLGNKSDISYLQDNPNTNNPTLSEREEYLLNTLSDEVLDKINLNALLDWIRYSASKGKPFDAYSARILAKEFLKHSKPDQAKLVEISILNRWLSLQPSELRKVKNEERDEFSGEYGGGFSAASEIARAAARVSDPDCPF